MDIIHQGECGQNAKWSLTSENTLIISGEGRMKDYEIRSSLGIGGEGPFMNVINDDYLVPWRDYSNDITQIVIEEGITYIGSLAFCNFQSLESVILPHSLSEIGICSFAVCPNLQEINLNSDISIAEWAFRGSPLLDNTNPEPLDDATKRDLDDLDEIKNEYDFWGEPTEESDNLFQTNRPHINITNTGIYYDYAIKSENDYGIYRYDRLFPQSQIHKTWKDCFFCPEAENYFQKIYLDSYKKRELFANKRKQESIEVDNYYLALIIRKAIAKYQFNQNVAKLRDEVTDKDIEAYIKTINEELNQVKFGLKESESFKKTMFWLWLFLENNLDCENTLSGLGFDNVKQIHTWLNSTKGISYSDSFYNLKEPYLACMEKLLERNDPQVIKTWYVISNLMPPGYDEFMRLDKMYIQELHTKHLWLINNLEFDVKFKMMLPPCYIRNCGNTDIFGKYVIKNLRKDIMKEFPLNSLYVEDELLRGADRHIWDFLINDKNDLGPYIKKEIYNDNKKNDILKYIGLSGGEDEEGVNSNAEYNPDVTAIDNSTSHSPAKLESDDKKTRYSELRKEPYYEQVKEFFSNTDIYDKKGLDENRKGQENQKASVYIRRFWEDIYYIAQKVEHKADLVGFMYILYESNCFNWSKMISILLDKMYDFYGNSDNTSIDSASDAKKQMKELERIFEDKEKPQWNEIRNYIQTMFNMMFMCDLKFEEINDNFKSHGIKYASSQFSKNNDMLEFADTFGYDLNTKELEKIKESRKKMNEKRKGKRKYVSPHKRTTSYDENELSSENTQSCYD